MTERSYEIWVCETCGEIAGTLTGFAVSKPSDKHMHRPVTLTVAEVKPAPLTPEPGERRPDREWIRDELVASGVPEDRVDGLLDQAAEVGRAAAFAAIREDTE